MPMALAMVACVGTPRSEAPAPSPDPDASEARVADDDVLHEDLTFAWGGIDRSYHFLESAGHAREPKPLVVVLHGGGATIDAFIGRPSGASPMGGAWLATARAEGFHVLIPQGNGRQWNDCRSECRHCGNQDDAGFIVALVEEVAARFGVDPKRIYVAGESNGGFMTLRLATEHPERFSAFGVVTALMPANSDCEPPRTPVPIAFIVGSEDKSTRYRGGVSAAARSGSVRSADASVATWVKLGNCEEAKTTALPDRDRRDRSTVTLRRHDCPGDLEVLLYTLQGGGHVPPSIEQPVSRIWESIAGVQNHDIETATELWRFFAAHPGA